MKELLKTLTDSTILQADYQQFKELFFQVFEIQSEFGDAIDSITITVKNHRITIDDEGISFVESGGRRVTLHELLDHMTILRMNTPFIDGEDGPLQSFPKAAVK